MASMAATTWRPAFSISTSDGIPMSSIVRRSASRICAVLSTRMSSQPAILLWYARPMGAMVNVNGRISDQEHAVVSVFDHGFLYGEGVYETIRTYHGEPFLFDRHMRRLRASAAALALNVPLA